MPIVVIIVMSAVAIGISIARINALRKRNSDAREATQARVETPSANAAADGQAETRGAANESKESFVDFLDAENAPSWTRAELDEWRRDFALACRYNRRPPKSKAPFATVLKEQNFSLPCKPAPLRYETPAQSNEKKLPPQSVPALGGKEKYREYIKVESASVMR